MGKAFLYGNGGDNIDTDQITAITGDILEGKTAYIDDSGEVQKGTMKNRGAVTSSLNAGASYTIPAGYHNGSGKITANSLASQTSGTATASQILSGQTAWINGAKVTGTIPVSYTHLTLPTKNSPCRSRWSPYH